MYCFDIESLLTSLEQLSNDNAQGEILLNRCYRNIKEKRTRKLEQ